MATRNEFDRNRRDRPPDEQPRKGSHPLFWLLVLIALFALGWSFYNRHAGESMPAPIRSGAPSNAPGAAPGPRPAAPAPTPSADV
jgi:protein TonB